MTTTAPALLPLSPERRDSISRLTYRELHPTIVDLLSAAGLDVLEAGESPLVLEPWTGLYGVLTPESVRAWHHRRDEELTGYWYWEGEVAFCEFAAELIALLDWAHTPAEAEAMLPPGQSLLRQLLRTPGADVALLRTARQVAEHLPAGTPVMDQVAAIAALTGDPRLAEQHAAMVRSEKEAESRACAQLRHQTFPWLGEADATNLADGDGESETRVAALRRAAKLSHRVRLGAWALGILFYILVTRAVTSHVTPEFAQAAFALSLNLAYLLGVTKLSALIYAHRTRLTDWAGKIEQDPTCKVRERGYAGVEAGSCLL